MHRFRFCTLILLLFSSTLNAQDFISAESTPETFRPFALNQPITSYDILVNRYSGSQLNTTDDFYRTGFTAYHNYIFRPVHYPDPDTNRSRSSVHAMLGTERDQMLFIEHKQNLGKGFSTGLHYQSLVSPGFLRNQIAKHKSFGLFLAMDKKRYSINTEYRDAKVNISENGGIIDTLITGAPPRSDLEVIPVNLSGANVLHRRQLLTLNQSFNLSDSIRPLRIHLDAGLTREGRSYRETIPVSEFYPIAKDTVTTYDTTFANIISVNPYVSYHLINDSVQSLELLAGINLRFAQERITQRRREFNWNEFSWQAEYNYHHKHSILLKGRYGSGEFASGNYSVNAAYTYYRNTFWFSSLSAEITSMQTEVAVTDRYYDSNHFTWSGNFSDEKLQMITAKAEVISEKLIVGYNVTDRTDKVLFDEFNKPYQINGSRKVSEWFLSGNVVAGKFGFHAYGLFRPEVISEYPQPEAEGYLRIAYRNRFFKEALFAETGASAFVTSAYQAPFYDPATGRYRQQFGEKIGSTPVVNIFLNLRIRTAVISIMSENFLYGWVGDPHYSGPRNPAPPRMLRLSVNWLMTN